MISTYLSAGTMQEGLIVKDGLLVLLTAAAASKMIDVLGVVAGMEAPDARKAVKIWRITSFHTILNALVFMISFA